MKNVLSEIKENTPRNHLQPQQDDNIEDEDEEENEEELEGWGDMPETDFKFTDFTKRLCHQKIIRACALALRTFEINSVHTNHCIVKLLHRIALDCKMVGMLYQASIFRTFQKIYASKGMPQFQELVKFATYVMRQFFKLVETNPKLLVEALFWKSCRDAYDIEQGYGSYQDQSAAAHKGWTEIEEDELRRLFMEYQEKEITEDVVDWVVNNLIDNTRTRRGVLKKLKEMCLLTDYKPRKSGISGKVPRQWGEDEEAQLRELYEQFKDAMDPLGCIMDRLDVHRPKNRIVEKLLVMGLIQDKKEVRKKRAKKSQGAGPQDVSDMSDADLSDCSDSDDDANDGNGGSTSQQHQRNNLNPNTTRNSKAKKSSKSTNKKKPKVQSAATSAELIKLLKNVQEMREALEWLKESFEDIDDDDDDCDEGVPLVAILDPAVLAMENRDFLKLLRAFGIAEPANEQETYWRIPSHFSNKYLRYYCKLITDTLENKLPGTSQSAETNLLIENCNDSSDEDVIGNSENNSNVNSEEVRESVNPKSRSIIDSDTDSENGGSNTNNSSSLLSESAVNGQNETVSRHIFNSASTSLAGDDVSLSPPDSMDQDASSNKPDVNVKKIKKSKRIIALEESDDDDDDEEAPSRVFEEITKNNEDLNTESQENNKQKGKRAILDSDSEEDSSEKENTLLNKDKNKRGVPSDTEVELPKTKRSRVLVSDDDDD